MKVIYLHQYFSTPAGSAGLRSYEFARALTARGHDVTMVCGSYDGSSTGLEGIPFKNGQRTGNVDGFKVLEFFIPYSNKLSFIKRTAVFLKYAWQSVKFVLTAEYDLVFATSTPLTVALPGILARWLRNKPFVFEVRDLWPELPAAMGVIRNPVILAAMKILEVAAYHSARKLVALSPGMVEGIVRNSISRDIIHMIPNGCDSEIFKPLPKSKRMINGVNSGDFVAIFSGTIGLANGVDSILNAAQVLKKLGRKDIKIIIIGRGKCKSELQQRAIAQNLNECVFMEPLPKLEVAQLIAKCDAGLMVLANIPEFYYGTSPNKYFDYISCGVPVINNYPGWIAEMIGEFNCGVAVPPDNPDALAQSLCQLADDRAKAAAMGQQALKLSKKFCRSELALQFCLVLESASPKGDD